MPLSDSRKDPQRNIKDDYIWNTLGSIMNAASSVILLFVITQIMGEYWGGVFAIAFALGQQFQTLGIFEMRPVQSTDISEKYSFSTYLASRVLTTSLMLICIVLYALFTTTSQQDVLIIILIASLKLIDSIEDVFHGGFQQHGRLDYAGKAFFFRSLITTTTLIVVLFFSKDIYFACLMAMIVSIIALAALNLPAAKKMLLPSQKAVLSSAIKLLAECLPLFAGAFLAMYLVNAPKFGLDASMPKEYQAYYAAIFMPALAINLLSSFVFRPLLTKLANSWKDQEVYVFSKIIEKGMVWVCVASVLIGVIAFFIGTPVLSYLMGVDLSNYRTELMILIVGGSFNALSIIVYYGIVVMRKQLYVLASYGIGALFSFVFAGVFIQNYGMLGAALLYTSAMFVVFIVLAIPFIYACKKAGKKYNS